MLLAILIGVLAHGGPSKPVVHGPRRTTSSAPVYRFVSRGAKTFRCSFDRPRLQDQSRLVKLDPGTGRTLASWSTDGGPRDVLLAFGSVWVANSSASTVLRLTPP